MQNIQGMKKTYKATIQVGGKPVSFDVELEEIGGIIDPPPPPPPPVPSSKMLVGSCTFPWVPQSKYKEIGMTATRLYCPWHWVQTEKGMFVQPMHQAVTAVCDGIDAYLAEAKKQGLETVLCLNQTPEWIRNTDNPDGGNNYPPIRSGKNRSDPNSYSEYANFLFQVAARYGRVKHPDTAFKMDTTAQYPNQPTNKALSGLNLLTYIECGNEYDRFWEGFDNEKYLKANEHAALLSKCYDEIKRADPSMQVVMAGLTDTNLWYLKEMQDWFTANRADKKFAADVINIHHYSNLGNAPGSKSATWVDSGACNPDQDKKFGDINGIVAWAKTIDKKVFVTEFGADSRPPSNMYIVGGEAAQAELITKSFEAYRKAGVDGAFVFTGIDEAGSGQFQSSGIFSSQSTGMKPKPAVAAIAKMIAETK